MNIIQQYQELERRAAPLLKAARLTMPLYRVTEAVMRLGSPTMGEVAEYVFDKPSTITAAIDRLEARGIVQRLRSTEDRRVVRIILANIPWFNEQHYAMQRLQEAIQGEDGGAAQTA